MNNYKIYVYEFSNKHCYVGLSSNVTDRDKKHHKSGSVFNYSELANEEIPSIKILEDNLDKYSAQTSELNWCKYYEDNGWVLINKAKTGLFTSSLGGQNKSIINVSEKNKTCDLETLYNECYMIAKKYNNLCDLRRYDIKTYEISNKYGWNFDWLKKSKPVNGGKKDNSYDAVKSVAMKYKTRTEFSLFDKTLYLLSLNNGWLDDFYPKKYKNAINDNNLISDDELRSVMLSYKTKTEFYKSNSKYYNLCRVRGLLNEFPKSTDVVFKKQFNEKQDRINKHDLTDFLEKNKNLHHCKKYNDKYIFNADNFKIYSIHKNFVSELRPRIDKLGLVSYNLNGNYVCITKILNDFIYDSKYNLLSFHDNNFQNLCFGNIEKSVIDLSAFVEMKELETFLINKEGKIYSKSRLCFVPFETINGYSCFMGFRVDKLVVKYFHEDYNTLKKIDVIHKDNDLTNNNVSNLEIELLYNS